MKVFGPSSLAPQTPTNESYSRDECLQKDQQEKQLLHQIAHFKLSTVTAEFQQRRKKIGLEYFLLSAIAIYLKEFASSPKKSLPFIGVGD